ncbi:uncharacterized protein LOC124535308 isoform X4 [Vanessa cardui]|uniref:uncharacterized protein LOC124535308 isoform X4 n=1 Tax=Vanessa cardui TaxID=171605 RepID=UPI001F13D520|nr:uncharacterized protein LOC124535308 isoform X4 [Vanessa cardui]
MKIAVFAVFIICSVVAIDEIAAQKNLMESNGTPLLQIPNFEESSSKSEEELDDKVVEVLKDNIKQARESELSDEVDSSDSGGDRRISTKGFLHDVFERESNPKIHGRYSKESEE